MAAQRQKTPHQGAAVIAAIKEARASSAQADGLAGEGYFKHAGTISGAAGEVKGAWRGQPTGLTSQGGGDSLAQL